VTNKREEAEQRPIANGGCSSSLTLRYI
jgi:hypothetical protein